MSHQAVNWAIEQRTGGPAPKATLWSIANYANEDWCSWPSQYTIGVESEQSRATVNRQVGHLEDEGLVRRIPMRFAGRRSSNFYILKPSPYFGKSLAEIEPLLPRGYTPIVSSETVDSEQSDPENDASIRDNVANDASNDVANDASNDASLVRHQVNPGTKEPNNYFDSARARVGFSTEAAEVADEITSIAGVDPAKHAKWFMAGPALIIQRWLDAGYQRWQLIEGVRRGMSKRTGPPDTVNYFGPIWQLVRGEAESQAPPPTPPSATAKPFTHTPRPGSREDRQERTANARRKLREYAYGPDIDGTGAGGEADRPLLGGLSLPKPV